MTRLLARSGAWWSVDGPPIAIGGQAAIYAATSDDDGHEVVVKVALVPHDPAIMAEAERLLALSADVDVGRFVVPLWDQGVWDDRPFLVLERRPLTLSTWAPGRSKAARVAVARSLVAALATLQSRGVVHGDVKPSNILMDDGGGLLLCDFGGAAPGTAGTAGFAAPEREIGAPADLAADRYSLGATLMWLLPDADPGLDAALRALRSRDPARRPTLAAVERAFDGAAPRGRWPWVAVLAVGIALPPTAPPCPAGFVADGAACAGDGRRVVWIPAGRYALGSNELDRPEWVVDAPARTVSLSASVWMDDAEVTQREWTALLGDNPTRDRTMVADGVAIPCAAWRDHSLIGEDLPVVCVSWLDAARFANARSARDGLQPAYVLGDLVAGADGWRLPTEAEWEIAARAGRRDPYGDVSRDALCQIANVRDQAAPEKWGGEVPCDDGAPILTKVRSYQPNAWGLYDMHGNALEWVQDWYGPYDGDATDPTGPATGLSRVQRGASWNHVAKGVAARYASYPTETVHNFGFRLVRPAQERAITSSGPTGMATRPR